MRIMWTLPQGIFGHAWHIELIKKKKKHGRKVREFGENIILKFKKKCYYNTQESFEITH